MPLKARDGSMTTGYPAAAATWPSPAAFPVGWNGRFCKYFVPGFGGNSSNTIQVPVHTVIQIARGREVGLKPVASITMTARYDVLCGPAVTSQSSYVGGYGVGVTMNRENAAAFDGERNGRRQTKREDDDELA